MGIDLDGVKHPLAVVEGSTENATLVTGLLVDLRGLGLDVTRSMLVGIDGSTALRKAVQGVLYNPGHPTVPAALCRPADYADVAAETLCT